MTGRVVRRHAYERFGEKPKPETAISVPAASMLDFEKLVRDSAREWESR